jgi:hypothetical protein
MLNFLKITSKLGICVSRFGPLEVFESTAMKHHESILLQHKSFIIFRN